MKTIAVLIGLARKSLELNPANLEPADGLERIDKAPPRK
jgi:hypothetical protein